MNIKLISKEVNETFLFGKKLASGKLLELKDAKVFLLIGELGSGKTSLVRGFCSHWKLDRLVSSPSFTIINEYSSDKVKISHIDLYRIKSIEEIEELGINEIIYNSDYVFIEWPELIIDSLGNNYCTITFSYGENETERVINLKI
ncbi:MAG: tRNA (adenosine(37)-N6)-threonylcarbamoyltransferase complex ATPase subunit type 1 TsaE [Brevinematia bacterium]